MKTSIQRQEACIARMLESRTSEAEIKQAIADVRDMYQLEKNAMLSMDRTTVYPSRAGGFPPASFLTFADALGYIRTINRYGLPCGICTCPATRTA